MRINKIFKYLKEDLIEEKKEEKIEEEKKEE